MIAPELSCQNNLVGADQSPSPGSVHATWAPVNESLEHPIPVTFARSLSLAVSLTNRDHCFLNLNHDLKYAVTLQYTVSVVRAFKGWFPATLFTISTSW